MNRTIVAILRGVTPYAVLPIGQTLFDPGIYMIEVPLNSPDPFMSTKLLAEEFGAEATVGAGTVTTPDEVDAVSDIGGS